MPDDYFPVYDITGIDLSDFEQMGTKQKFWFFEDEDKDKMLLFKATVAKDNNGNKIQRHGEDWAEKIVCEIAKVLKIPCANYELGICNGQFGVISENFVQKGQEMVHGNELVAHVISVLGEKPVEKRNKGHRLYRVALVLMDVVVNKPLGWDSLPNIKSALDFFCGYVMLDTLVSNQDRHDENWGLIKSKDGGIHLAPSYDHAASLGRNESDDKRHARLYAKDKGQSIAVYVKRSKSQFLHKDGKRIKNLLAFEIFGGINYAATVAWLDRLEAIDISVFRDIIYRIPPDRMSDVSKEFTFELLKENRKNLLGTRSRLPRHAEEFKKRLNRE